VIDHAPSPVRLEALVRTLDRVRLTLVGGDGEATRRRTLRQARDYLLPRLADPTMTLVVAVVGPSGGGKSTLVNSVARRRVSPEGAVRPATRQPVAWCDGAVPATLDAMRSRIPGRIVDSLRPPPEGIVVVDTPPPEITGAGGRPIAADVLEVADVCVFVAGASRYADVEGFELLQPWAERGMPTVFVLNRLPESPEMQQRLTDDFALKLSGAGFLDRADGELIVPVAEGPISPDSGGLPSEWVSGVAKELQALADPQARPGIVDAGIASALAIVERGALAVRRMAVDNEAHRISLLETVRHEYDTEARRLRDRLVSGELSGVGPTVEEMTSDLATVVTHRAGRAARRAAERWADDPGAGRIVGEAPGLFGHGPDILEAARERVGWWVEVLPDLAAEASGTRLGRRKGRKIAEAARRTAVDPSHRPRRRVRRFLQKHPEVVPTARARLAEELTGVLASDARRFEGPLGPPPPDELLTTLTPEGDR
jgi:energy-coupling factor transporter ATP-binding protein EcfA2